MQTIGNGTGSLFGGGGGEQRLRPHHNQGFVDGRGGYHQTSFKCPRCDSLNTKFCYYNNYNLSQPRFFCKDCRRYWTKGGVLRNVPVGGGCRKTKRSKQKPGTRNHSSIAVAIAIASELKPANSQNSSTNSSPATMKTPFTLTEAVPTPFNFQESCFNPPVVDQCCIDGHSMLSETGTFKSLLTSSTDLEFSVASEITSFMQQQDEDQIVERQDSGRRHCGEINGGVAMEDWGLFDLSYWWNNNQDDQLNYYPI